MSGDIGVLLLAVIVRVEIPMFDGLCTVKATLTMAHKEADWPDKEECDTFVKKMPQWNEYPTVFMPAENKGFE